MYNGRVGRLNRLKSAALLHSYNGRLLGIRMCSASVTPYVVLHFINVLIDLK